MWGKVVRVAQMAEIKSSVAEGLPGSAGEGGFNERVEGLVDSCCTDS